MAIAVLSVGQLGAYLHVWHACHSSVLLSVEVEPPPGPHFEPGPLMQHAESAALAVVRAKLHHPGLITGLSIDDVKDLQPDPVDPGQWNGCGGPGTRMPGSPDVVGIFDRIGAIAGPHQRFGGTGLVLIDVQGAATVAELIA